MSVRPYVLPAPRARARAVIEGGRIVGSVDLRSVHELELGVVFDGALTKTIRVKPDGAGQASFSFTLFGLIIPGTVDFEDMLTGQPLLSSPMAVDDEFSHVSSWFKGTTLRGIFSLAWAPHTALPIQVFADADVIARGIARCVEVGRSGRATYHIEADLASLPLTALRIQWAVMGRLRPETAMTVECSLSGYLDKVVGSELQGWLIDTSLPEGQIAVEVRRGERVVARTMTGLARPDVARVIRGGGTCGFRVKIPEQERLRGADESYRVVVGGTRTALHGGSDVVIEQTKGRLGRLDEVAGGLVTGWAVVGEAGGPASIEVVCRGEIVGRGLANLFRADLAAAGLGAPGAPPGFCAFEVRLPVSGDAASGEELEVRAEGEALENSPLVLQPNPNILRFRERSNALAASSLLRLRDMVNYRVGRGFLSLVMVGGAEISSDALSASLSAVVAQWCSHWELVYVHEASPPAIERVLQQFARRDQRFRIVQINANNLRDPLLAAGVIASRFEYIVVLRPGDLLEPESIYHVLRGMQETKADALYTDSYSVQPGTSNILQVEIRTAFSVDGFRTAPFTPALMGVRTRLARQILTQDMNVQDFSSAVLRTASRIAHMPVIGLAHPPSEAPAQFGTSATVFEGSVFVLVMASEAPSWLTDAPFPFEAAILGEDATTSSVNEAVSRDGRDCDVLLLIGAEMVRTRPGVLQQLASLAARSDVAAAGPVLVDRTGRIVAAGLILGGRGVMSPSKAGCLPAVPAPTRDVSALPAELLFVKKAAWDAAGGLDPRFKPGTVGVADLCIRIAETGAVLIDESSDAQVDRPVRFASGEVLAFASRHADALRSGDPWYNPFLADDGSWALRNTPCRLVRPARVVLRRSDGATLVDACSDHQHQAYPSPNPHE